MRLRTRVTLVSAALMAVVLAATGAFVYLRLETELRQAMDETLRSRAEAERLVVEGIRDARPDDRLPRLRVGDVGERGLLPSDGGRAAHHRAHRRKLA